MEKEMATRSSILPRKSHGQRTLVGYSPRGCQRVRHDKTATIERMKEGWERGKGRVRMGGGHFSESTLEILTQLN